VGWVPAANQHLTLKFLGEIGEDRIDALVARASAKLASVAPFEVALAGFGSFPNAREARVLWLGVARGAAFLAKVARKLDGAARVAAPSAAPAVLGAPHARPAARADARRDRAARAARLTSLDRLEVVL
jgi:2'-5' RNA ligase